MGLLLDLPAARVIVSHPVLRDVDNFINNTIRNRLLLWVPRCTESHTYIVGELWERQHFYVNHLSIYI